MDIILMLLLIICVVILFWGVGSWWYSKQIGYLLKATICIVALLALPFAVFVVMYADSRDIDFSILLFSLISKDTKLKMIELDKSALFSEDNTRCHTNVLIRNPPESVDSIKKLIVGFFCEKQLSLDSTYPGCRLLNVDFYKYTVRTAYFIKHVNDPGGFHVNTLDSYPDKLIGSISTRLPCERGDDWYWYQRVTENTTTYEDIMKIHDKNGGIESETLYRECDGIYIDNWDKYK